MIYTKKEQYEKVNQVFFHIKFNFKVNSLFSANRVVKRDTEGEENKKDGVYDNFSQFGANRVFL
jgi:hypothetical protein